MNEMLNGAPPRRALHVQRGLALALFGGFAIPLAACPGPTPQAGTGGSGGEGSSTSTSSSASTSMTSSSSGGMPCTLSECPASKSACMTSICEGTTCGFAPAATKTLCMEDGGTLCDGTGHCVMACGTDVHCMTSTTTQCNGAVYTAPSMCISGMCKSGQVEDCGATGRICTPTGCGSCTIATACGSSNSGCIVRTCNNGLCEKVNLPQGSKCPLLANGTCDAAGLCVSHKHVFVTSTLFPANFGGTVKADAACNYIAGTAGLDGMWKSWTSDGGSTPLSTPSVRFTKSAGPYMLLDDQTVVASNWTALTGMTLESGINMDENKQQVSSSFEVWTGTTPNGSYAGSSCNNWTFSSVNDVSTGGVIGISGDTTGGWTNLKKQACTINARLYCFQQ